MVQSNQTFVVKSLMDIDTIATVARSFNHFPHTMLEDNHNYATRQPHCQRCRNLHHAKHAASAASVRQLVLCTGNT